MIIGRPYYESEKSNNMANEQQDEKKWMCV